MIAGAYVMHVANGALGRVRARTTGRQQEPREEGVIRPPLFDGRCLLGVRMVHHDIDPLELGASASAPTIASQRLRRATT